METNNSKIEFLSWEGTLSRGEFWKAYLILGIPNILAKLMAPFTAPAFYEWVLYCIFVFTTILIIFQVIKRMRGVKKPLWMLLLLFVPFVNLYIVYLLLIKR